MNGIFNTGLSFWQLIVGIITVAVSFVAIKVSLSFDINKYLDSRSRLHAQKLRNACPHVQLKLTSDGKVQGQSLYVSPPGDIRWQCQQCGQVTHLLGNEFQEMVEYYLQNIDEYHKQDKKFTKLLKRSGQI